MEINNAILECKEQMIAVDIYGNTLLSSYFIEAIQSLIDKAEEENEVIRHNHKIVTDAVQPYKNALEVAIDALKEIDRTDELAQHEAKNCLSQISNILGDKNV